MDQRIIHPDNKLANQWYNAYKREVARQMKRPMMQKYASKAIIYEQKDFFKFVEAYGRFLQEKTIRVESGELKSIGNPIRDFFNATKFRYSYKQAKALVKGFKSIDEFSEDYNLEVDDLVKDIIINFQEDTKDLSFQEKLGYVRTDIFNILNENVGALSEVNEQLKAVGNEAQEMLDNLRAINPNLDENDAEVRHLKDLAKYQDSYSRKSYIGNRLFDSPE